MAKGVLKFNVQQVLPLKEAAQVRVIDGCCTGSAGCFITLPTWWIL